MVITILVNGLNDLVNGFNDLENCLSGLVNGYNDFIELLKQCSKWLK